MYDNIKLSEIMSTVPAIVLPSDTMDTVDHYFKTENFHHLPVVDKNGKVVGIISKSDYLALCDSQTFFMKEKGQERNLKFFRSLLVEEVMTQPVVTLRYDTRISIALGMFRENLFRAIPIVDEHNKLVGIVTTMDLINHAYRETV